MGGGGLFGIGERTERVKPYLTTIVNDRGNAGKFEKGGMGND